MMQRYTLLQQLAHILCCLLCISLVAGSVNYEVEPGVARTLVLVANETNIIQANDLQLQNTRFVVIQMHSQKKNISLSSSENFTAETTKEGKNVGIVTMLESGQDVGVWYSRSDCAENITVSIIVLLYSYKDPIPGGCNQVFNLPLDPSLQLEQHRPHRTGVLFQWANMATPPGFDLPDCEKKEVVSNLEYEVYVYFMQQGKLDESEFIHSVHRMLKPEDVKKHGTMIHTASNTPTTKSRLVVSSRSSQGVVYSIMVRRKDNGHVATYTTTATYNCDLDLGNCDDGVSAVHIVLAVVCGVAGLFLVSMGHRYFRATQVLFGFIIFSLITYISVSQANIDDWVLLATSCVVGTLGGGVMLAVWHKLQFPTLQVFLMGFASGYVVSSTIFFSPFGNLEWWESTSNYALAFVAIILFFTVCLMAFTKLSSIVSCAIVGSFLFLWPVAVPLWASLELVLYNSLYHQTETGYQKVVIVYPANTQDIVLYILWPVLAVSGIIFQLCRERGHSGFSKPFETMRAHLLQHHQLPQPGRYTYYNGDNNGGEEEEERYNTSGSYSHPGSEDTNGERSRLLAQRGRGGVVGGLSRTDSGRSSYRSTHSETKGPTAPIQDPDI